MRLVDLVAAGLLELVLALGLKYSQGLTRLLPTMEFSVGARGSFYLLTRALHSLPLGNAYAVWTGIGAAGTALIGIAVLGESRDALRLLSLALIIAGVIGLRLAEGR